MSLFIQIIRELGRRIPRQNLRLRQSTRNDDDDNFMTIRRRYRQFTDKLNVENRIKIAPERRNYSNSSYTSDNLDFLGF